MSDDKTRLAYWFPLVQAAGLPVPRTEMVAAEPSELDAIWKCFDGEAADYSTLTARIKSAAESLGGAPVFLRTDLTSGKHGWRDTCCVTDLDRLSHHVYQIAEFSAMADMIGMPFDVWAVREMLPTAPAFTAFWGHMPITREFRFFVRDGAIEHWQPYWPAAAIEEHAPSVEEWRERLSELSELSGATYEQLREMTRQASAAVPGFWSVDWLHTSDRGWVLTDMAEGDRSYRWEPRSDGTRETRAMSELEGR